MVASRFVNALRRGGWVALVAVALLLLGTLAAAAAPAAQSGAYPGLDDPDAQVRAATVQAIREARDRRAVPALIAHLDDPDQQVGLYIAQGLVELATREQLTPLLLSVGRGNTDSRWRSAYVLGARGDARAIPALTKALDDDDVLVMRTAAEALAGIGSQAAISPLVVSLGSARQAEVHAAMRGLLMAEDSAVPALRRAYHSGGPAARENAGIVLEAMGTSEAEKALR
jgi:HEAT repeat protein